MNAIPHEHLMRAASSISEIAREMQDLAGGTDQMWQDVQRLFTTLVSLDGDATAIIIPIDDADMIKASAQLRLVRQIRLLGACRNAIPIVALKDGEIARHLIRETRNEYYPGAGFKADFDAGVEREVHDAVAQQLRKTFPQWATYRMPQPSWRESVHYRPRGDHRDFVDLLAAAEPRNADRSLVVSNMLLDPTGPQSTILDTGQVAHLLPTNLRKLAQLWSAIHLSTVERTGQRELDALARVLESLQNVVDRHSGSKPHRLASSKYSKNLAETRGCLLPSITVGCTARCEQATGSTSTPIAKTRSTPPIMSFTTFDRLQNWCQDGE